MTDAQCDFICWKLKPCCGRCVAANTEVCSVAKLVQKLIMATRNWISIDSLLDRRTEAQLIRTDRDILPVCTQNRAKTVISSRRTFVQEKKSWRYMNMSIEIVWKSAACSLVQALPNSTVWTRREACQVHQVRCPWCPRSHGTVRTQYIENAQRATITTTTRSLKRKLELFFHIAHSRVVTWEHNYLTLTNCPSGQHLDPQHNGNIVEDSSRLNPLNFLIQSPIWFHPENLSMWCVCVCVCVCVWVGGWVGGWLLLNTCCICNSGR